jgi:hypothetical protein
MHGVLWSCIHAMHGLWSIHPSAPTRDMTLLSPHLHEHVPERWWRGCTGVSESDAVIVVVDGQTGLQAGDQEVLSWLRQKHPSKKVLLAVNKCDNTGKADIMVRRLCCTGLPGNASHHAPKGIRDV